ncbi:unnamed protein product [Hyaloperonospora brassicae]|uniref:RxLR effector protein n=1 Tax=Hyaloperonospora brassicae TaxID=162125 RepID=A0AAV0SUB7_HYABA|nr:unnamed protein product [Hyaloperonospora brassicae]
MRPTGLYVAIVLASLHASGSAASTSKDADAPLSENKATSMSVASPRANGKRSLRAEKRNLDGLDEDRAKTVGWTYTGVQNKIKTFVQEGRLTENEGSNLLKGIKLLSKAIPSDEPAAWVEEMMLLNYYGVITRKQLKQALEIVTGLKLAPSSLGKKVKWTQLEELKKRQAKL